MYALKLNEIVARSVTYAEMRFMKNKIDRFENFKFIDQKSTSFES